MAWKKAHRTGWLLGLAAMTTGAGAAAAQVTATKTTVPVVLPDIDASLDVLHYTNVQNKEGGGQSVTPKARFSPSLGMSLFDERMDVSFTAKFDKTAQTTQIEQKRFEAEAEISAYSGDVVSISPYAEFYLPHEGSGTDMILALDSGLAKDFATKLGSVLLSAGLDVGASFSSREQEVTYKREGGAASASSKSFASTTAPQSEDVIKGTKKHPDFYHEWDVGLSFNPNAVKDLTIGMLTAVDASYTPEYTVDAEGNKESTYLLDTQTYEGVYLVYGLTDKLSLANELYYYQGGVYASPAEGTELLNVAYVSYDL